jgi:mono/diheme cytochrome c family protein
MDTNEIILAVVCAVLVVFSLTVALVVPKRNPDFPVGKMVAFFAVSIVLVGGMLTAVEVLAGEEEAEAAETTETVPPTEPAPPPETGGGETVAPPGGDAAAGKEVFTSAGCGGCHTLADAGAAGTIGPSLDETRPAFELVVDRVTNGLGGMPAFAGQLDEQQIQDVAAYVAGATSG